MDETLLYFSLKYHGDFSKIYNALLNKIPVDTAEKKYLIENLDCNYITLLDSKYPQQLKMINNPPLVLYYQGNIDLLNNQTVSIVGTHNPTQHGESITKNLSKELNDYSLTLVTGGAKGIQTISMMENNNNNGKNIIVLPSGFNNYYPKENTDFFKNTEQNGLVLSEYPPDTKIKKQNTLERNRIIAGLSDFVIATEILDISKNNSSLEIIQLALDGKKNIYSVPNLLDSNNLCNALIYNGANIALDMKSIIENEHQLKKEYERKYENMEL